MQKIGHILLIHYKYDPVAWLIRFKTKSFWNHVAWIWDDRTILECKKSGIRLTWDDVYNNKKLYITKRIKIIDLTPEKEEIINRFLINYPKKVNLLKRMISFLMLAFNSDKDLLELTCSGFIAIGCAKAGIYFHLNKKPSHITPEDINNSKIIKEI
jgi:hypothetical protein